MHSTHFEECLAPTLKVLLTFQIRHVYKVFSISAELIVRAQEMLITIILIYALSFYCCIEDPVKVLLAAFQNSSLNICVPH